MGRSMYSIKSWDENTWDGQPSAEVTGEKLTLAEISVAYQGQMHGESRLRYLMSYNADGSGTFIGLERFEGTVDGCAGSFVIQHLGSFNPIASDLSVLPDSATGALKGLRGQAHSQLDGPMEQYPVDWQFSFG